MKRSIIDKDGNTINVVNCRHSDEGVAPYYFITKTSWVKPRTWPSIFRVVRAFCHQFTGGSRYLHGLIWAEEFYQKKGSFKDVTWLDHEFNQGVRDYFQLQTHRSRQKLAKTTNHSSWRKTC